MFFTSPNHHTPEAADHLLTRFFSGCDKEFGFLERKHGFSSFSGLTQYHKGRRVFKPFRAPSNVELPFEASTIFEKDDISFEINYGGAHYTLGLYISYNRINRFQLRQVFEAARKPVSSTVEDVNAYNTSTLESALHEAGLAVRNNTTLITAPNPKLVERTLTIHEKRMELAIRTQFRRDMEDAAVEAARAFRGMNWPRVIELLSPYEGHLNAATTKKLVQARKFIIDI